METKTKERFNTEETEKRLEQYEDACNDILELFCQKHGFDYEDARISWIGVGETACCGDLFFNMADIMTDIRENAPEEEVMKWYDYELRCGMIGISGVNYASWLKGCPIHSETELKDMEESKRRVEEAERIFKETLKKYNSSEPY